MFDLRSTISGRTVEQADPDGAEWREGELTAGAVTATTVIGSMQNAASSSAKIEAQVAQEFAERAERERARQTRWWGRR